jgi:hypothetical protein
MPLFLRKLSGVPYPSNQHTMDIQPPDDLGQLEFLAVLLLVVVIVVVVFGLAVCLVSDGYDPLYPAHRARATGRAVLGVCAP